MEPRKYELKNGRVLLIREVSVEDARALLDYVKRISGESDFLSFGPGEFELTEGLIGATLYLASGFLPLFGHGTRSTIKDSIHLQSLPSLPNQDQE
jgi:hypothetical protein